MTGELRNHRLRKTWDFQKILKGRRKVYNSNFVIFYEKDEKNPTQGRLCRFGISIPQRIVKKSVLRNKYKRQTKHALLELQRKRAEGWMNFKGWSFLIIIREKFTTGSFEEKKSSLEKLFNFFAQRVSNRNSTINKTFPRKEGRVEHYFEKTKNSSQ